jgi:putative two-component system response regulator
LLDEQRKQARILVIDDEPQNVRYIIDVLKWAGYERVEGLTDPLEAVERARESDPDLLILDLLMPDLDGFGVMASVTDSRSDETYLPILVLTSDISSEARRKALGEGAKDFLIKPMSPTELRLRVDNLLETRFLYLKCAAQARALGAASPVDRPDEGGEIDAQLQLLEGWAASIERSLSNGVGHAKRVSWLSGRLADALDLPAGEVELIRRAALLHDLGSVGLESSRNVSLLEGSTLPVLRTTREMLSGLAEHWDGNGLPSGLREGAIPISARIVAVAEHFDSLIQMGSESGITTDPVREIERLAGHRFDPAVVEALVRTETVRAI